MDKNNSNNRNFGETPLFAEPITDADISHEELLKIKQRFEEMQAIAKFGTWDWDMKNDRYSLSDGACNIYGLDPKANILDHESITGFIHPDDRKAAAATLQAAMDEKKTYSLDYRVIRPGGEVRHVHEYGSAVYSKDLPVRAFGSIKDITENMEMQDKLKESELLYRTLFDNTLYAFIIVELIYDANGNVFDFKNVKANDSFEEHTGLNPSEAVGRLASEARPDIELYWIEMFEKAAKAGKPLHYQNYLKYTNRWYDVYCFPYTKDRIGAIFRDITQYKAAEEALNEANESNRQLLDSINDGYAMFDRNGNILSIGKKFAERFGKTTEEFIGANIMVFTPEETYGDLGRQRIAYFQKVLDTGRPVEFEDTRDGRWLRNRFFPVYIDGEIKAVSLFSTDITDKKKAEEETLKNAQLKLEAEILRKKEREYLELLDGPEEGMRIVDLKEKCVEFSPKWAQRLGNAGFLQEELFRNERKLIHADDLERVFRERREGERKGLPVFTQEYRILTGDSDYMWILDRGKILYDENGSAVKVYAASMDITARKKAEETLGKALLRERVLGGITGRLLESEDPQAVMEDICRKAIGYIDGDVYFNYICEGGRLHLNACSGIPSEEAHKLEWLGFGEAVCGCAARDGKRIIVADVQNSTVPREQPLKSFGLHSYASFPLKSDDHVIGTLAFGSRKRDAFSEDELLFLSSVSEHVAIAMNRLITSRALRESEERYRRVVENTSAVILRLDTGGMIRFANQRALEFFGYREDELIGKHALETIIPDRETNGRNLTELIDEISADPDRFRNIANENMRKNGERVWVEWTNSGIYDGKGLLKEFLAVGIDATERKRAEEALRESEEKYRELVEHSPAGIYEIDSRTGKFMSVNDVMCLITGYSREEFLKMTPLQLMTGEDAARFRQRIKQWRSGEEPGRTVDYKLITKDGRAIYVLLSIKFIKDEKGSPLRASVIAHDITERKKAEERINRQNLILQTINRVYEESVICATQSELGGKCISIVSAIIGNNAGFIGEVGKDGMLHDIAISLGTETSDIPESMLNHRRANGAGVAGLYRSVMENAESILTNEPSAHPDSAGTPEGHFKLKSFLGAPFVQNGTVLGLIGLANKKGGFSEEDRQILEAVTPSVLEVLIRKRTEEALKESESKYGQLVKYAPAGIYEIDFRNRRFTSVNDVLCRMSGYSRKELLEMDPAALIDQRGNAIFLSRLEMWMRGKKPKRNVDYRVKTKDGGKIYVSLDVSYKKDGDGRPLGATAIVHDITQRKKDEALINRKNRILQVINHIHERSVYCVTMNELELACLETVNAVTNSGVSFIGKLKGEKLMYEISLSSGTGEGIRNVHRRLGVLNHSGLFRDVIDSKASLLKSEDLSCPDGTGVSGSEIEVFSFLGVPFIRDGKAVGLIAAANREGGYSEEEKEMLEAIVPTVYEVLMRKRAEEALKESEERLAAEFSAVTRIQKISASFVQEGDFESILYNILKAAMMISGAYKGTLQLLRPGTEHLEIAAQLGFDQSYIGSFSSSSSDSDRVCEKALEQEERVIVEDVTRSPIFINTPALDIELAAGVRALQSTPLINRRGKVIGILSTHWDRPCYPSEDTLRYIDLLAGQAADIIEKKRAEEELKDSEECALALVKKLEEADRNKNDFLSSLSHEIRNPLATISAGLQLMDISRDEKHIRNAKEIINRQMDQLCSLVDDLLDLTRISNNKIELKKQRIDLGRLVSFVAKDHIPIADKKGLRLNTELCEDIYINADPVRIRQIIGNLLHNALKFTETGTITLSAYKENGTAVVCVKDPGIGISPENLSRIFEPFMQLGMHIDRENGGLGLGLSIVKAIALLHGGDAGANSEGEGKGSEFYIRLPVLKNEAEEQEEITAGEAQVCLKVLVIEDSRDYSEMICELFKFLGHDVKAAPDGFEGIEKAQEFLPDLIVCDIGMPGISGLETAKRLREYESLKNVFMASITGYAGPRYAEDSRKAGFDMHITKPAEIGDLKLIVFEALNKRRS